MNPGDEKGRLDAVLLYNRDFKTCRLMRLTMRVFGGGLKWEVQNLGVCLELWKTPGSFLRAYVISTLSNRFVNRPIV